jgi:hypothetical protein
MECDILDVPQERLPGAERPRQGGARAGYVGLESGIAHNLSTSAWFKLDIFFISARTASVVMIRQVFCMVIFGCLTY